MALQQSYSTVEGYLSPGILSGANGNYRSEVNSVHLSDSTDGVKRDKNQRKRIMKIDGKGVLLMMLAHYPLSFLNTNLSSLLLDP